MPKLREYQELGADFLYETDRALILAKVGAGKTALAMTAMWAMVTDGYVKRWLVLAPKRVATDVWPVERNLWMPGATLQVAVGKPAKRHTALMNKKADVVVATYDNIQSMTEAEISGFDGIVFDELTKLKNPSGKRFKALMALLEGRINFRWGLTGSFTSNGLEDTFGQCRAVSKEILGEYKTHFLKEYFVLVNRDFGIWAPKGSSLEKVMARIKPYTFTLENADYADSLPPLNIVQAHVKADLTWYNELKKKYVVNIEGRQVSATSAGTLAMKLIQMAGGFIYPSSNFSVETEAYHAPGGADAIWMSRHKYERLDEILDENQHAPTIVVYNFQAELEELKRRYPNLQTIDKPNVVERWNKGSVELLAIHPKSAGHGLNLQYGGGQMVFLSLPWSFELYEQTIGRLHRSGQKSPVWVYLLMTEKTKDREVFEALADKRDYSVNAEEELK